MIVIKGLSSVGFAALVGLGMMTGIAHAQYGSTPEMSQKAATDGDADVARVKKALHGNPALDDKHIEVTMEKGRVVLRGFVGGPLELQKALKAATDAAGGHKVVNDLTIKQGGDGGSG